MRPARHGAPRLAAGARLAALAAVGLALLATSAPRAVPDRAAFAAASSCGPAGVVTLWSERRDAGCGGSYDLAGLVHAEGGPAVGLPALGEIEGGTGGGGGGAAGEPGWTFLLGAVVLLGDVPLAGAVPPVTVHRTCRLSSGADDVLLVACEGPDPEAACTGTLTLQPVPP